MTVYPLHTILVVAGIAATGGVRPSTDGANKRSGSRYVMGDLLGRGGMAEVFAGYAVGDHGFQKPVAIKRLLPELANDEVFVDRLIEEAKLLVGMQHGHIVSVLDLAREGDDVFLVMEFVDGPSLRQLIKARGARGLSLGVATYIVQSAAAGLEFAHARPGGAIIHADISPSNLLLTTSGEVRVADFGIARREGLGQGVVEGKWAYMAPEQARGESLTPRSDVFALGVVLYELLTGQHPFGRTVTANERDDQMRVIPPRVVKPTVPHGLDAICMRALAHDARDRYGRMQQLIDALVEERFTNGYREGASDLAQAIREVAPKSDNGAPRTMHTERPVTLMTRSLLRDITPARRPSVMPSNMPAATPSVMPTATPAHRPSAMPSAAPRRPSATPAATPAYPLGPMDPPPRDAFPMQPTLGVQTMARLDEQPQRPQAFVMEPTVGVATTAWAAEPPLDAFPMQPSSGVQTMARDVDQAALAEAAAAAAAMFQLPGGLRADGTPMPRFRMSDAALQGDELASVVGGHTMTGHAGSVAVEHRGHRGTIAVLAAAALIGVGAAIAIQLHGNTALDKPAIVTPNKPEKPFVLPSEVPQVAPPAATQPAATQPTIRPTITDTPVPPASQGTTAPTPPAPPAPQDTTPTQPTAAPTQPTAESTQPTAAPTQPTAESTQPTITPTQPTAATGPQGTASTTPESPKPPVEPGVEARSDETRPSGKRSSPSRDAGRRKEPGILSVQSKPWSWVTVSGQRKETPDKFYLAPGTYVVKFHNQENGLTKYERVTIESGKRVMLNEGMDQ
jgi:serine/threonine protein kinase